MPDAIESKRFSWLHFSDWHFPFGEENIPTHQWKALLDDLAAIHKDSGPWDALFISGDLAYGGRPEDYKALSKKLLELLVHLRTLGSRPVVLAVPGNHDGAWYELSPPLQVLLVTWQSVLKKNFSEHDGLRDFFSEYEKQFGELIDKAFAHYLGWNKEWNEFRQPWLKGIKQGLFPGDFSATLAANGLKVGVVGFNTAIADLTAGNVRGSRRIDMQQLKKVCGDDPDEWTRRHDFSILMTHHAPSQLEPESRTALQAEISPPGRFLFHLCGSLRGGRPVVRLQESPALLVQAPPARWRRDPPAPGYVAGSVQFKSDSYDLSLRPRRFDLQRSAYRPDTEYDPALLDEYQHTAQRTARRHAGAHQPGARPSGSPAVLDRLELVNFRSFKRLSLGFTNESKLGGQWTCLAGINGAGKSSILQALCMILLGEPFVSDLGSDRLRRARRLDADEPQDAELRAWVDDGEKCHFLELKLTESAAPANEAEGHRRAMLDFWKAMRARVFLAYGATRNLSDYRDNRHSHIHIDVRRVMTIFDPSTQVVSAEVLLAEYASGEVPLLRLFRQLLKEVFGAHLDVRLRDGRVWFTAEGVSVDALDLPDGFRSSVAWLADLCAVWCEKFPGRAPTAKPRDIEAIVLIDEIDLHLHPSLQRTLVPRLRAALPRVQWIVTTHSPLILSSFDSAEIVALDRREPGGVRFLDRQILGFTTDQIYNWLMGTPASSAVMEAKLAARESGAAPDDGELARLVEMSPDVNEAQASERVRERRELIEQLESLNP